MFIKRPRYPKMRPHKEKLKNRATRPAKTHVSTYKLHYTWTIAILRKSKMKSITWFGMVRMIESLSSMLPPSSNFRRCFKKSWDHRFCDHLEIFILSLDLRCLLKIYAGFIRSQTVPCFHLSQKHTEYFEKFRRTCSTNQQRTFYAFFSFFFNLEAKTMCNFKISNSKLDLKFKNNYIFCAQKNNFLKT